jgi:hypothetical protein
MLALKAELPTQKFDLREIWAFFQGVFNFFKGGLQNCEINYL